MAIRRRRARSGVSRRALCLLVVPVVVLRSSLAEAQAQLDAFERFLPDHYLTSPRSSQEGRFGDALALEGTRLVVGAPGEDATGKAYVFEHDGANWVMVAVLSPAGTTSTGRFGSAVALSGATIAVGEPRGPFEAPAGRVHVFVNSGASWVEQAQLLAPPALDPNRFATTVALDGNTLAVSAALASPSDVMGEGRVVVFRRDGATWRQEAILSPPPGETTGLETFGNALAVDDATLLVGMAGGDRVYAFRNLGGTWTLDATWTGDPRSAFGASVDLDGGTAIVGAPGVAGPGEIGAGPGKAHVFVPEAGNWSEQARLASSVPMQDDRFGEEVAISGNVVAVAAPESAPDRATRFVAVFVREGAAWAQREELKADASRPYAYAFPGSLALSGQTVAFGVNADRGLGLLEHR